MGDDDRVSVLLSFACSAVKENLDFDSELFLE